MISVRDKLGRIQKIYYHNLLVFSNLNNNSCYWAGFLAGDGYIHYQRKQIRITLSNIDTEHLYKFKNFTEFTGPIKTIKPHKIDNFITQPQSQINILCSNIVKDLEVNFKITNNKSLTLQPPNFIEENYIKNYIRGIWDADGGIWYNKNNGSFRYRIGICGTYDILLWIQNNLIKYVSDDINNKIEENGKIFSLMYSGRYNEKILDWLYKDSTSETRLDRKYQKYIELKEFYKNNPLSKQSSQYKGVVYVPRFRLSPWMAKIQYCKKPLYLGSFKTELEAANAYDSKAHELGLLDRLNFK